MELADNLKLIISSIVAVVGLATFIKTIIEYKKSSNTKRLELFLNMRTRLREDKDFVEICQHLVTVDAKQ